MSVKGHVTPDIFDVEVSTVVPDSHPVEYHDSYFSVRSRRIRVTIGMI